MKYLLVALFIFIPWQLNAADNQGEVVRAQLTSNVDNHEPVDDLGAAVTVSGNGIATIYYFTELQKMGGQTVTHRWQHNGKTVAEVDLNVGTNRWRTFSSKRLTRQMLGDWSVYVVADDHVIHKKSFQVAWE